MDKFKYHIFEQRYLYLFKYIKDGTESYTKFDKYMKELAIYVTDKIKLQFNFSLSRVVSV